MSISRFSLIATIDNSNGLSKNGQHPWHYQSVTKFFKEITTGKGRNVVIMGRVTYEMIPQEARPLPDRHNIVISREWRQEDHLDISVYPSIIEALYKTGIKCNTYDNVIIMGGERIFQEVLNNYMYLCDRVYITKLKSDFSCDQYFDWDLVKNYPLAREPIKTKEYTRYEFIPNIKHPEDQYITMIKNVCDYGEVSNHNDKPINVIFKPATFSFDYVNLGDKMVVPIFTTNHLNYDNIIHKLIFMLSGKTDTKIAEDMGVLDWADITSHDSLKNLGFDWEEGDVGPYEGFQWRHFGSDYDGFGANHFGADQIKHLVDNIKSNPKGEHLLTSYNPSVLNKVLPGAEQTFIQFYVSNNQKYIDCNLTKTSNDLLYMPNDIFMYYLLFIMIAHVTNNIPRHFNYTVNKLYANSNYIELFSKLSKRTPKPLPHMSLRNGARLHEIDQFNRNNIVISNYSSWHHLGPVLSVSKK